MGGFFGFGRSSSIAFADHRHFAKPIARSGFLNFLNRVKFFYVNRHCAAIDVIKIIRAVALIENHFFRRKINAANELVHFIQITFG